uniref:Uncharacterized protein n=1 Tax=viral metagenome TaxID=1070528 RepID=A0A6C0C5Z3_9ZZZZ
MVLGYLLYEVVDLGVNVVKITYNGVCGAYYWWYSTDSPEVNHEVNHEVIAILTNRIEELEKTLGKKN